MEEKIGQFYYAVEQGNRINDRDVQSCITMKQRMGKSAAILNNVHSLMIVSDLLCKIYYIE